jgi:hypothetical protein
LIKADYVLVYKNRKLAVIEAKKDELPVSEGVGQAKDYAQKLKILLPTLQMEIKFMKLIILKMKKVKCLLLQKD